MRRKPCICACTSCSPLTWKLCSWIHHINTMWSRRGQGHWCEPSFPSVLFSSVAQSYPTLWNPMDCCTPGFLIHHQPPELAQTHVHRVDDAIQPSYPLYSKKSLLGVKENNMKSRTRAPSTKCQVHSDEKSKYGSKDKRAIKESSKKDHL